MRQNGNNGGTPSWVKGLVAVVLIGGLIGMRYMGGDAPIAQGPPEPESPPPAAGNAAGPKEAETKTLKKTDLKVGTGKEAKTGDHVTVNYRGTLTNGTVFDQSYGKKPFDFDLGAGGVIKGWDVGVVGMKEGGKRKLVIPPGMGYGASGSGPIPPNATLIFEVELLKVG